MASSVAQPPATQPPAAQRPVAAGRRTTVQARPRFEGSNINTWIGFKHVMYLVEEAVLDALRRDHRGAQQLYEDCGLGVDIVDSDARILHALHIDDVVRTEVVEQPPDDSGELVFRTESFVDRPAAAGPVPVKAVTAKVRVVLRRTADAPQAPAELAPFTVPQIERAARPGPAERATAGTGATGEPGRLVERGALGTADETAEELARGQNAVVWRWRIPYFYCHFSQRLQHSGYLRVMEEVVDLFLAERGISIRTMLDGQRWIPVVPHARVEILHEALMEEQLYTVFSVAEIFKDLTYTARMDCYVRRDGQLVHTATGTITHGYAVVLDRRDWRLVPFDEKTLAALRGDADSARSGPGREKGAAS